MADPDAVLHLPDPDATDALARRFAAHVQAGDTLLLEGPIGAGKSHFARALIRALTTEDEEVPSPTYTLVQTYVTEQFEIWHADLYRLSDPAEVVELGLLEAFESALCLVEWPERLGELAPADALSLRFAHAPEGEGRIVTVSAPDAWHDRAFWREAA